MRQSTRTAGKSQGKVREKSGKSQGKVREKSGKSLVGHLSAFMSLVEE